MSIYRHSVHEYLRACEALLASADLSEHEMQAVEAMMTRLSDQLLSSGEETNP
jgi:hypothetical protein